MARSRWCRHPPEVTAPPWLVRWRCSSPRPVPSAGVCTRPRSLPSWRSEAHRWRAIVRLPSLVLGDSRSTARLAGAAGARLRPARRRGRGARAARRHGRAGARFLGSDRDRGGRARALAVRSVVAAALRGWVWRRPRCCADAPGVESDRRPGRQRRGRHRLRRAQRCCRCSLPVHRRGWGSWPATRRCWRCRWGWMVARIAGQPPRSAPPAEGERRARRPGRGGCPGRLSQAKPVSVTQVLDFVSYGLCCDHEGRGRIMSRDGQRPHHRPRRPRAQSQEHRRRDPPGSARRHHRSVRLGQVLAGLRHHLRRGAAALRRVAVGLRPAVPGADGEARGRLHRGPLAGHLDRAEDDLQEPALDRRHRHRDLRLPARAVRPRRHPALSQLRPGDLRADRAADGRSRADAAGRHAAADPGAGDPRAQGRVQEALLRPAAPGLLARARERLDPRPRRRDRARPQAQAHDRGRRRPPHRPRQPRPPPRRLTGNRAPSRRRHRAGGTPRRAKRRQQYGWPRRQREEPGRYGAERSTAAP